MNRKTIPLLCLMTLILSGLAWADAEMKPATKSVARYEDWRFDGPEGRGFPYYLAQNYRRYAKHEDNSHDFRNAAKFLARAEALERGELVDPEPLTQRTLPVHAVTDLSLARDRLVGALDKGARGTHPKPAAHAQMMFDCWMEQQEENIQPHEVHACRQGFEDAMAMIQPATLLPAKLTPVSPPLAKLEPVAPTSAPTSFIVYFDFDRYDFTVSAKETLQNVIAAIRERRPAHVTITGHADRAGADSYNETLSRKRLDGVTAALRAAGITEKLIDGSYYGERKPRVPTPDGERNPENRRVEVTFD